MNAGITRAAMLSLCIVFCACSQTASGVETVARSHALLTRPPTVLVNGAINNWGFSVEPGSTKVALFDRSGVKDDVEIAVLEPKLLMADTILRSGVQYLVVGTLDVAENFSLYRYHDSTGDGAPDAATRTLLFSSMEPVYGTFLSMTGTGTTYLLDRRCQDILVAIDSDADGWPDELNVTPYARSANFPSLLSTRAIRMTAQGSLLAMVHEDMAAHRLTHDIFTDTNADLVADTRTTGPLGVDPISLAAFLVSGQESVTVQGESGAVEVWELNANAALVTKLGSAAVASASTTVTLSRPLVVGELIGVKYAASTNLDVYQTVIAKIPQVLELDPPTVATNQTSVVALSGQGFTTTMVVKLSEADGTLHTLVTQYVSATSASVTVPSLVNEGVVMIHAEEPAQDQDVVGARGRALLVRDPE